MDLDIMKYIASSDEIIQFVNANIVISDDYEILITNIINIGKTYYYDEKYITQHFDPWIYIAGYSSTKDIYWNKNTDTLNEIYACFSYITFGYKNGYIRNFLGPICNNAIAKKILYNIVKIAIVGNSTFTKDIRNTINNYDIICRCNRADNFDPLIDKIDYLIYRNVVFNQSCKLRNKVKSAVNCAKAVVEIDGDLQKPSKKLLVELKQHQVYFSANSIILCEKYNRKKKKSHIKKPSTGFIGLRMLLHLYPTAKIHMYGFNFTGVYLHNWEYEKSYCINNDRIVLH